MNGLHKFDGENIGRQHPRPPVLVKATTTGDY